MESICSICEKDPKSHSFVYLGKESGIQLFYSCPFVATHFSDNPNMITHIENALNFYQCDKIRWKWIFDADRLGIDDIFKIRVVFNTLNIVETRYTDFLHSVQIVNASWYIKVLLNIMLVFSSKTAKKSVKIIYTPIPIHSQEEEEHPLFGFSPYPSTDFLGNCE
jgi:hypothetical protein